MAEAWKTKPVSETMLPAAQATFDEKQAADYFRSAIENGQAHQLLADLNKLDAMLREMGMQDSDDDPVDCLRALQRAAYLKR